jgi:hypothetical protein
MHLSIATHICGGKVVAVKWSLSGEKATCGMESPNQKCAKHEGISSNCCQNEVSLYTVDNNYAPSSFQFNEVTKSILQIFNIPVSILFHSFVGASSICYNVVPPDIASASAVSLAEICILRI